MKKVFKGLSFYLLIFIIIVGVVQFTGKPAQKVEQMEFSQVYQELTEGNVSRLYFINDTSVEGVLKDSNVKFRSYIPEEVMGDTFSKEVLERAKTGELSFGGEAKPSRPIIMDMLPSIMLLVFMGILWFVFMNQSKVEAEEL